MASAIRCFFSQPICRGGRHWRGPILTNLILKITLIFFLIFPDNTRDFLISPNIHRNIFIYLREN